MSALLTLTLLLAPAGADKRLDLYGDPLPTGAVVRFGTLRLRHAGLCDFAVRPGGAEVVTVGRDHAARTWNLTDGRLVNVVAFQMPSGLELTPLLSPDGAFIAALAGKFVLVRDAATGGELARADLPQAGAATLLGFTPGGPRLAYLRSDKVVLWHWPSGAVQEFDYPGTAPGLGKRAAFSPDGRWLAITGSQTTGLLLVELTTGRARSGPPGVSSLTTFTPDSRRLAIGRRDARGVTPVLLDPAGQQPDDPFPVLPVGPVVDVAFAPDGRTLVAGEPGGAGSHLYRCATGNPEQKLPPRQGPWRYHPDGRTLLASAVNELVVWDVAKQARRFDRPGVPERPLLALSADGSRLVSASWRDPRTFAWDAATGRLLRAVHPPEPSAMAPAIAGLAVGFAHGGRTVLTAGRGQYDPRPVGAQGVAGEVFAWDVATGVPTPAVRLAKAGGQLTALRFAPNGDTCTGLLYDGTTGCRYARWRCTDGALLDTTPLPADWLAYPAVAGAQVFHKSGVCQLWDHERGRPAGAFGAGAGNGPFARSADGRLFAYGTPTGLRVVEVASGANLLVVPRANLRQLPHHAGSGLAFTASGRGLHILTSAHLTTWDLATDLPLAQRTFGDERPADGLLLSPDGHRAYTPTERETLLAWELPALPPRPAADLAAAWVDLGDPDAGRAWRAVWALADAPAAAVTDHLRQVLSASAPPPNAELRQLIRDLDDDAPAKRNRASGRLAALGERALPALRHELKANPPPEARRRINELLARAPAERWPAQRHRAVVVLERFATEPARALLRELAAGADDAASEAKWALARLVP